MQKSFKRTLSLLLAVLMVMTLFTADRQRGRKRA